MKSKKNTDHFANWLMLSIREKADWILEFVLEYDKTNPAYKLTKTELMWFNPAHDANCDRIVLNHIKASWPFEKQLAFVENLKTIRWPRANASLMLSGELFSETGDYAYAAYITIKTNGEVNDPIAKAMLEPKSEERYTDGEDPTFQHE